VTNCTFYRNNDRVFGKRWWPSFQEPGTPYFNNMYFYNCIIWEPDVQPFVGPYTLLFDNKVIYGPPYT
jgi:hypothetical protein